MPTISTAMSFKELAYSHWSVVVNWRGTNCINCESRRRKNMDIFYYNQLILKKQADIWTKGKRKHSRKQNRMEGLGGRWAQDEKFCLCHKNTMLAWMVNLGFTKSIAEWIMHRCSSKTYLQPFWHSVQNWYTVYYTVEHSIAQFLHGFVRGGPKIHTFYTI